MVMLVVLAGCARPAPPPRPDGHAPKRAPKTPDASHSPMRSSRHLSRQPPTSGLPFRAASLAWSPDGRWIAVGGRGRVMILRASSPHTAVTHAAGRGRNRITYWPDGQLVSIGSNENNSYFWSPKTQKMRRERGIAMCAHYHADAWSCESKQGRFRVTYGTWSKANFEVKKWSPQGYRKVWAMKERTFAYPPVMVLRNAGRGLLVAGGTTYSRTQTQRMIVHRQVGMGPQSGHASFFKRVPKLVSGGYVRQYHRGRYSCERTGVGKRIISLGAKRYGATFLTGHLDGMVSLFDRCTLKWSKRHGKTKVVGVAHHPVDHRGASVDAGGRLCWWDLAKGKRTSCRQLRHP